MPILGTWVILPLVSVRPGLGLPLHGPRQMRDPPPGVLTVREVGTPQLATPPLQRVQKQPLMVAGVTSVRTSGHGRKESSTLALLKGGCDLGPHKFRLRPVRLGGTHQEAV